MSREDKLANILHELFGSNLNAYNPHHEDPYAVQKSWEERGLTTQGELMTGSLDRIIAIVMYRYLEKNGFLKDEIK